MVKKDVKQIISLDQEGLWGIGCHDKKKNILRYSLNGGGDFRQKKNLYGRALFSQFIIFITQLNLMG